MALPPGGARPSWPGTSWQAGQGPRLVEARGAGAGTVGCAPPPLGSGEAVPEAKAAGRASQPQGLGGTFPEAGAAGE